MLSERAQKLIPKAKIFSYKHWKKEYSDEVLKSFCIADLNRLYLDDNALAQIKSILPEQAQYLDASARLRDQAEVIVGHAREKVLLNFPDITKPGGELYPAVRAEACWRDFWHFLRCISYGVAAKEAVFTSNTGLENMKLLYEELEVPLDAMIYGLEHLKIYGLNQIQSPYPAEFEPYFDHLIFQMKSFLR